MEKRRNPAADMTASLTVRMDRPIVTEGNKHIISPGGYEAVMKDGNHIRFDWIDSAGTVDRDDPCVISFELTTPDFTAFPEMEKLHEHILDITGLEELYIYTGEGSDPEIHVEGILSFQIFDRLGHNDLEDPTEYVEPVFSCCGTHCYSLKKKLFENLNWE